MTSCALDTTTIIAAVCSWHEFHERAAKEVGRRLSRGERVVVPAQALLEAYSVLTRLPAPFRLSCSVAWALLRINFVEQGEVVSLDETGTVKLLDDLASKAIGGGKTYDSVIAACAVSSACKCIVTFNPRHFEPPPRGITVVVPA